jgi:hypothetical protein
MKTNTKFASAAAILAGGMMFAGNACAADVIVNGSFESASPTGWPSGFSTYNYSAAYYAGPAVNANDDAAAGTIYSWNNLGTQVVGDLATAAGITTATIDAGAATFALGAWLASYTSNPEYPGIELRFFDTLNSGGAQVGSTVSFGATDSGGLYNAGWDGTGARPAADTDQYTWTYYQVPGQVPVGARRAEVTIVQLGSLAGSPDTYVDVVSLDVVPEPSVLTLGGLALLGLLRRRRS